MKFDSFEIILDLAGIRKKNIEIKSIYNPNLIANLSIEMHDRYLIRDSICNDLLKQLEQQEINKNKIQIYIEKKIKWLEEKYKDTQDVEDAKYLQMAIEEWKNFLTLSL